jgi:hypothetical protein
MTLGDRWSCWLKGKGACFSSRINIVSVLVKCRETQLVTIISQLLKSKACEERSMSEARALPSNLEISRTNCDRVLSV